jgi:hypothetical protein
MTKSITLIAVLVCVCVWPAAAQTTTGSIAGSVIDQSGGAIVKAKVTAVETTKNYSVTTVTDSAGRFVFPEMPPGIYTITAEAPGFKKFEKRNVNHQANENLNAGVLSMQVGQVTESVEVAAQGLQLQTESGERSESLTSKQMTNIALNSRSYLPLVALVPGVTTYPTIETAGHSGIGSITANGARSNQNNLTLDGVGNVDTGNNGDQLATISLNSVQEFRILTSNYQAEYGRSSGSQISVVTKSGTNEFHGSGYIYHRNESLNANNWYNNRQGLQRNLFRFNDAGYTFGGPVYGPRFLKKLKNKVYFFTSEEFQNQLQPQSLHQQTVPTALERQGDFSRSVDKNGNPYPYIRDYTTGKPCSATNTSGCFQDGGVLGRIPASRLSPVGLAILNVYPLPNAQSPLNKGFNLQTAISAPYPRREDLGRVDININDKNKLFVRFINNYDAVTSAYGSFVLGTSIPKVPITDSRPGRAWAVNLTSNLSPTIVNEFTWGFGKNVINITPTTNGLTRAANGLTGLPVLYPNAIQDDFIPTFGFNGTRLNGTGSFGTNNAPFFNYNTSIEWTDNFSKVWNQHVFKIGFYAQRSRKDQTSFANANGSFDFGDNSNNPYDSGFGFANAALGVYSNFNQASSYLLGKYRYSNIEWYAQDTWKIKPNFTLDFGIRFYWVQPQYDAGLQTSNFLPGDFNRAAAPRLYRPYLIGGTKVALDPAATPPTSASACTSAIPSPGVPCLPAYAIGDIVQGSGNLLNGILQAGHGINKYLVQDQGILYSPRLGFAWDITGTQRLVLRGGGGIFYDRFQGNEIFDEISNPPATFTPNLYYGLIGQINPQNIVFGPSSLHALDYAGPVPTTANYSLGIQTKLPYQLVLDTAYVGSKSWHLLDQRNLNAIPYGTTFLPQNQDPTNANATPFGSGALPRDFLRPYPGYGDITLHQFSSTSNFNSLQVSLNRRFVNGLFVGFAYTFSKALGVTSGDGDYVRIDNLTRFANYGPLSFDRRHTLAINYIYPFPSLFANHAVAHALLDGWQISGLTRLQTGTPYEVSFSIPNYGNQNLTGSYTEPARVQVIGAPLQGSSQSGPYGWLNANAFGPPPVGGIGLGEGRYPFYGPGINDTDLSLQKDFAIKERYHIELRVDAFNVFNHPQFGGVGGNGVSNNSGIFSTVNFAGINGGVQNAYLNANGTVNNINGFGTVSGARDPRILQLSAQIVF